MTDKTKEQILTRIEKYQTEHDIYLKLGDVDTANYMFTKMEALKAIAWVVYGLEDDDYEI